MILTKHLNIKSLNKRTLFRNKNVISLTSLFST